MHMSTHTYVHMMGVSLRAPTRPWCVGMPVQDQRLLRGRWVRRSPRPRCVLAPGPWPLAQAEGHACSVQTHQSCARCTHWASAATRLCQVRWQGRGRRCRGCAGPEAPLLPASARPQLDLARLGSARLDLARLDLARLDLARLDLARRHGAPPVRQTIAQSAAELRAPPLRGLSPVHMYACAYVCMHIYVCMYICISVRLHFEASRLPYACMGTESVYACTLHSMHACVCVGL